MEFLFCIALLPSVIQFSTAATVMSPIPQTNRLCSTFVSPMPTVRVRDASAVVLDRSVVGSKTLDCEVAVYNWTGCYIQTTDSQVDFYELPNVSELTPSFCANACATYSYFSLLQGTPAESLYQNTL